MRHEVTKPERPERDLYITERKMVEYAVSKLDLSNVAAVWDPCACGLVPYTFGQELATKLGSFCILTDLHPRGRHVLPLDYLEAPRPRVDGRLVTISNPPYNVLDQLLRHWWETAEPGDVGAWLVAFDSIPVAKNRYQSEMAAWIQPDWRLAFLVEPHIWQAREYKRRADGKKPRQMPEPNEDGLVKLTTTGKSHGVGVWVKGWEGRRALILPSDGPLSV